MDFNKIIKYFLITILAVFSLSSNSAEWLRETRYSVMDYLECPYKNNGPLITYSFFALPYQGSYAAERKELRSEPLVYNGKERFTPYDCDSYNQRYVTVTNYRPEASFIISQQNQWPGGTNKVTITSTSTDIDGMTLAGGITEYEWWVNGVKQHSTSKTLVTTTFRGGIHTIKLRVVDTGTIGLDDFSGASAAINFGEPVFFLSDSYELEVYLEPWSCGGPACMPL